MYQLLFSLLKQNARQKQQEELKVCYGLQFGGSGHDGREVMAALSGGSCFPCVLSQEVERDECCGPLLAFSCLCSPLLYSPWDSTIFRVGLPASVSPSSKLPHGHTQGFVSQAVLDAVIWMSILTTIEGLMLLSMGKISRQMIKTEIFILLGLWDSSTPSGVLSLSQGSDHFHTLYPFLKCEKVN